MYLSGLSLVIVIFNNRLIWRFVPSQSRAMHRVLLAITGFFPWLIYSTARTTGIFETNATFINLLLCAFQQVTHMTRCDTMNHHILVVCLKQR